MITETLQIGTQSVKSVASTYDELSFRTGIKYPGTYPYLKVKLDPDVLNRISQVKDVNDYVIAGYTYVGPSRLKQRTYPQNYTALTVDYDDNAHSRNVWKYSHNTTVPAPIVNFEYSYDAESNKLYEERVYGGTYPPPVTGVGDAYLYDKLYRLTGVKYGVDNDDLIPTGVYANYTGTKEVAYELDGAGNRNSVTTDGGTPVTYGPNE